MKRFIILILLSILIINSRTFAFLFGEEKNTKDSRAVAVTVNGAKIYEDTLLRIAKHRAEETAQSNPDFELTQARNVVIGEMVLTEVIIQEGRKKLVWVADKEVQDLISRWEGAPYDELKKNEGFKGDFYEYERGIKASAFIYPKLLLKEYSGKLEPTEEQMKTYYNQHINEYCHQEPEKYRLKIIQFWFDEDTNNPYQTEASAKADAQKVLQKIQNGKDFDVLDSAEEKAHVQRVLKKLGIEQSEIDDKVNDIFLTRNELKRYPFTPEFENVVLSLKPGQMSGIIKGDSCFCIVKYIERISEGKATTDSFEEVKEELQKRVSNELQEKAYYEYVQRLMKNADIKYTNPSDDWRLQEKGSK